MSLPHYLHLISIEPNPYPSYIVTNESKRAQWHQQLYRGQPEEEEEEKKVEVEGEVEVENETKDAQPTRHRRRPVVGIVCNGLLSSFIEKHIPLASFQLLAERCPHIQFVCLHKREDIQSQLDTLPRAFADQLATFDLDNEGRAFEDTIAILENLDLLITIDTSIVHLAGVMHVPTVLLIGFGSDWRWFSDNTKVWYDSVELMRMTENRELAHILPQVAEYVSNKFLNES